MAHTDPILVQNAVDIPREADELEVVPVGAGQGFLVVVAGQHRSEDGGRPGRAAREHFHPAGCASCCMQPFIFTKTFLVFWRKKGLRGRRSDGPFWTEKTLDDGLDDS